LFSPTEGNYFNKNEINEVIKFLNSHSGELGKFNANSVLYSNEVNKENYGLLLKSQNDILSSLEQLKNLNPVLQKMILNSSKIQPISLTSDILTISIIIFASLLIIAAYMTLRYSLISGIILFLKSLFAIVFTLSLILITKAKISTNLLDSLILSTMFIINDSIINSSKIKFEFTKDVNTKNYIFDKAKISEIFRTNIIQILSRQLTNLTT
jgi:protein-export membrane protein secD